MTKATGFVFFFEPHWRLANKWSCLAAMHNIDCTGISFALSFFSISPLSASKSLENSNWNSQSLTFFLVWFLHPCSLPLSAPEQARPQHSAARQLHQSDRPSESRGLPHMCIIAERGGEGCWRLGQRGGRWWGCSEGDGQGGEPSRGEGGWREKEEEDLLSALYRHVERNEKETLGHCGEQVLQQGHYDRYSHQHHQHGHRASQPGEMIWSTLSHKHHYRTCFLNYSEEGLTFFAP